MARVWKCEICLFFTTITLKMLVRHVAVEHASKPNFKVKCGVDGCPNEYKKMNSFRKHLRTCHAAQYSVAGATNENQPGNEPIDNEPNLANDDRCLEDDHDDFESSDDETCYLV